MEQIHQPYPAFLVRHASWTCGGCHENVFSHWAPEETTRTGVSPHWVFSITCSVHNGVLFFFMTFLVQGHFLCAFRNPKSYFLPFLGASVYRSPFLRPCGVPLVGLNVRFLCVKVTFLLICKVMGSSVGVLIASRPPQFFFGY